MRYILAPAIGTEADDVVIATALAVAKPFPAHIVFLHVRLDVARVAMAAATSSVVYAQKRVDALDSEEQTAETRARASVERLCAAAGVALTDAPGGKVVTASFMAETGDGAELVASHGRFADLIVLARQSTDLDSALQIIETTLLGSDRPLLIAAPGGVFQLGGVVVIAWTDAAPSLRAVHGAKPVLARAERVVIVCVDPDADQEASAEELRGVLTWLNPNVSVQRVDGEGQATEEALMRCATELGASLLVMGGYSHSPLRQLLFGGATKSVLSAAALPVLIAH